MAARNEKRLALADLNDAGRRFAAWGVDNPAEGEWRSTAALAHLALGDRDAALRLSGEDVSWARSFGAPRALGIALRAHGLIEAGDAGIETLEQAVGVLADSLAPLEYARALVDLGARLRRERQRRAARERLSEGLVIARRSGAVALVERAYQELEATGARPRKIVRSGAEELTPSEQRVCRMAANGMTNKEIAQALFVTVKTVETHLSRAYQKLEIRSRSQLGEALQPPA